MSAILKMLKKALKADASKEELLAIIGDNVPDDEPGSGENEGEVSNETPENEDADGDGTPDTEEEHGEIEDKDDSGEIEGDEVPEEGHGAKNSASEGKTDAGGEGIDGPNSPTKGEPKYVTGEELGGILDDFATKLLAKLDGGSEAGKTASTAGKVVDGDIGSEEGNEPAPKVEVKTAGLQKKSVSKERKNAGKYDHLKG